MTERGSLFNSVKSGALGLVWDKLIPHLEKLRTQLHTLQQALEKKPESVEQFIPGIEKIRDSLMKASGTGEFARQLKPIIGHLDQTLAAISEMNWPRAIKEVKEANRTISRLLQEAQSK